jgi:hypothetical protein
MVEARSLRTMAAPRQKEIKESATVVAITTFGFIPGRPVEPMPRAYPSFYDQMSDRRR